MTDQAARRFAELTDDEIVELTDEQINRFIDYECAMKGVPLLPLTEPVAPEKPASNKDVEIYEVGNFHFAKREDALDVAAIIASKPRIKLDWNGSYSHQFVTPMENTDVPVQTERHYSREQWDREKAALMAYDAKKKEYDSALNNYRDAVNKRDDAGADVLERLSDARSRMWRRHTLEHEFDRYVELANGDRAVAARFLRNAHHDATDVLPDLYTEVAEGIVEVGFHAAAAESAAVLETASVAASEGVEDDYPF